MCHLYYVTFLVLQVFHSKVVAVEVELMVDLVDTPFIIGIVNLGLDCS